MTAPDTKSPPHPAGRPRGRRGPAFRLFLFVLLLAGAAAAYLAVQGPGVIIGLAQKILRDNGLPEVEFAIGGITLETVTLEGIRVGREGALKIPRISAVFTWRELIDGEVGEISIDDLELTVRRHVQGLTFGELDPFVYGAAAEPDGDTAIADFRWPFRKLALARARITLLDEGGSLIAAMVIDGAVTRAANGGLDIGPGRISATSPEVRLAAAVTAAITGDGKLSAGLVLEHGAADIQDFQIVAAEGRLDLSTPLDDLSALSASGLLRVSEVALPFGFATTGDLTLSVADGRLDASIRATDRERGLAGGFAVATTLAEPLADQPVHIAVSLSAEDAPRLPDGILPVPVTQGAANMTLSLTDTAGNLQALAGLDGLLAVMRAFPAVDLALQGSGIAAPALPGLLDVDAALRLEHADENSLALFAPGGLTVSLTPEHPAAWRSMLGRLAQSVEVTPLRLDLVQRGDAPLVLLEPGEVLQKARIAGGLRAEGGALPALLADLSAAAILDPEAGIFDARVEQLSVAADKVLLPPYTLDGLSLTLTGDGTERQAGGTLHLASTLSGGDPAVFQVPAGQIDIPATWFLSPNRIVLGLEDCASFAAPKARTGGIELDMRGVRFCLRQTGTALLDLVPPGADRALSGTLRASLTAQGRDIVALQRDGTRIRIGGNGNRLAVNGALGGGGAIALDADVALGEVILPDRLLKLSGLDLSADGKDIREKLIVGLRAGIEDLSRPLRFAPVDLTVDAGVTGLDAISATGTAAMRAAPLKLEWEAEHSLAAEKGRATLRIPPFEFGYGVNRLADITSLLKGIVSRPAGQLLGAASASWAGSEGCGNADLLLRQASAVLPGSGSIPIPGEITAGQIGLTARLCANDTGLVSQAGQLLLDGMEFEGDQVAARAINANIDIRSFQPFATAPEQALSVGAVELGFPLTDGLAVFQISDTSVFDLQSLGFNWAGGVVSVAPLRVSPDTPLQEVDLTVEGAQLQKLAELVPDKGITGEGMLDGRLPIRLTQDGPAVEKGYLEARGPGVLRYKTTLGEGEQASTVDDVLSNLQYSKLRLDIDGGLSGGVVIGLNVEGKNPDYLDGYPVVLDVNVSGPLGAIMNDGLATYQVPSQILERMRRFGQLQ